MGLIASLQEQSSYVAIEMMRYGLPVITTAVDGLDEMFDDGANGLKVATEFSLAKGLRVNVDQMAEKLSLLITRPALRKRLGQAAFSKYRTSFTATRMLHDIILIYQRLAGMSHNKNEKP